ncbi:hypothetical protein AB0B25_12410 [Nocardia sp. NPDC049190]|uniref:hypothetical protein n=1 Tax=Nocardia sp. NPDC049190 TaxID=3155650 RepID=UPI0033DBFAB4
MVQPTPWQAGKSDRQADLPSRSKGRATRRQIDVAQVLASVPPLPASFRKDWAYLCAAVGNVIVFYLLFKPWGVGNGPDGKIATNAFGRLRVSTTLTSLWSGAPPTPTKVNGTWAVLASVAIAVTVFSVLINLQARTELLSRVATGATVAVAFFVVMALVDINSKLEALRGMVSSGSHRDMGTQIGLIIRWASGNGSYPMPGARQYAWPTGTLTTEAWLALAFAAVSALVALTQWVRGRPNGSHRWQWRLPVATGSESSESDHADQGSTARTGKAEPEQAAAEQTKPEQTKPEQTKPEQATAEQAKPGQAKPGQTGPDPS